MHDTTVYACGNDLRERSIVHWIFPWYGCLRERSIVHWIFPWYGCLRLQEYCPLDIPMERFSVPVPAGTVLHVSGRKGELYIHIITILYYIALFTFALFAMIEDLRTMKIPNQAIAVGWGTGLVFQLALRGLIGVLYFTAGAAVPVLVLYVLFTFRMIGAGDIKLLSVLGSFMGPAGAAECIIASYLTGAVIAIGKALAAGNLRERLWYFINYIHTYIRTKEKVPYIREGDEKARIHFSVPIFLAVLLYIGGVYH